MGASATDVVLAVERGSVPPAASLHSDAGSRRRQRLASAALRAAAGFWYVAAVLGQLVFALYVAGFYGGAAVRGRLEDWNKVLPHGYDAGDVVHNVVLASHLLFAVAIILGGAAQLLPAIRRRWPAVHRWNGRAYVLSAIVLSVGGLILSFSGKTVGDAPQHFAIRLNAILILVFAALAWRHARARRFDSHRRWALRLFLAVSGVWFFRVGLMLWIAANQGPVGFDPETFTGPFLSILAFAQYLLPLAVLELYFRAQDRRRPGEQWAMAATLAVLTLAMSAGIAAAAAFMWLPRL